MRECHLYSNKGHGTVVKLITLTLHLTLMLTQSDTSVHLLGQSSVHFFARAELFITEYHSSALVEHFIWHYCLVDAVKCLVSSIATQFICDDIYMSVR